MICPRYDQQQRKLEDELDSKTADLIHLKKVVSLVFLPLNVSECMLI